MSRELVTLDLARRLVADQFPQWASLTLTPVELPGWDKTTFRLGKGMLVRLPRNGSYALQVEKEHRWLPFLGERLPLPIPVPLARGEPSGGFPHPWSVYRWLPGRPAAVSDIAHASQLASDLAAFLRALYAIEPAGGPAPGEHNFARGAHISVYDAEARRAIERLHSEIDARLALETWESAMSSHWTGSPVWVHGDVAAGNLLVQDGRLTAVIDFGCCALGDPACDLVIAWTFFDTASRDVFRRSIGHDDATWARARGWALWKAAILLTKDDPYLPARNVLNAVLVEHRSTTGPTVRT